MTIEKIMDAIEKQKTILTDYHKKVDELQDKVQKNEGGQGELKAQVDKMDAALDKLDKFKDDMDKELQKQKAIATVSTLVKDEHLTTFENFIRKGDDNNPELKNKLLDLELKMFKNSTSVGTDANGGFAVPDQLSKVLYDLAGQINTMRGICRVIKVSTPNFKELVNLKGAASGWVGETDARSETGTPQLAQLTPFMGEQYANPYATQQSLDDIFFDVGQWLVENVLELFSDDEESAFISGNGTNKPKGILAYTLATTDDGTRAFGEIQYGTTGKADGFLAPTTSVSPVDCLIDLMALLKTKNLKGASFLMNRLTQATARKFKDAQGAYIWQPSLTAGTPNMLLGHPVKISDDMPNIAADAYPIMFGNFKKGYTIVDRVGIRVLRDPYSAKPYVGFYTTRRVGGMVKDSEAIKVLKVAA